MDTHIAFQCLKRSGPVQQRISEIENQGYQAGEDPILLLLQEIQALILHLKGRNLGYLGEDPILLLLQEILALILHLKGKNQGYLGENLILFSYSYRRYKLSYNI